jgi:hypothetical protein
MGTPTGFAAITSLAAEAVGSFGIELNRSESRGCCLGARRPSWVKMRRTRIEHMLSAYYPIATAKRTFRSFRAGERPPFAERTLRNIRTGYPD